MKTYKAVLLLICCAIRTAKAADGDGASVLAQILADKGTISLADLSRVQEAGPAGRLSLLTSILQERGILNAADMAKLPGASRQTGSSDGEIAVLAKGNEPPISRPSSPATLEGSFKTGKRIPVSLYGTLLFNAGYNTAGTNIEDVPLFLTKQNSDPTGGDKNFYSTVRQTRIGLALNGVNTLGAKLTGDFEFDMFGGQTPLSGGINMNLFRMRLAYGRLDWKNLAIEVGQDWTVFAPLNPISFSQYGIPPLSASGNAWVRSAQIRVEVKHASGGNALLWQSSAADPNLGDYNTSLFSASRTPSAGERGRMPSLESRLAYTRTHDDRKYTVGLSGHYGRGKNAGVVGTTNVQSAIDSWGVALDYSLPIAKKLTLVGEAYEGRALGLYSIAAGESYGAVGTVGAHGVESRGGWFQAQTNLAKQWQLNLGYGQDAPTARQLPVGNRTRNQTYMGNMIYKLNLNINLALEYRRLLTDFRNQTFANERGDHVDLAILYTF